MSAQSSPADIELESALAQAGIHQSVAYRISSALPVIRRDRAGNALGVELDGELIGGGQTAPYMGQVATRCSIPNNRSGTNTSFNMLSTHFMRERVSAFKIALPNFIVSTPSSVPSTGGGAEQGGNGIATYRAAVWTPGGDVIPFKFSGSLAGNCPDATFLWSDMLSVPQMYEGDQFNLRVHCVTTGRIVFLNVTNLTGGIDGVLGEKMAVSTTALADLTLGGTITSNVTPGAAIGFYPVAIAGMTTKRSYFLLSDSRFAGATDTLDKSGDVGDAARSIGSTHAYINAGVSSDRAGWWIINNTNRLALSSLCSDAIVGLGINDLINSVSSATLQTSLTTLYGQLRTQNPTQRIYCATMPPVTTSSDSWAVTANQTTAASNANRVTVNDWMRTTQLTSVLNCVDIADGHESYRNSGLWNLNGVANYITNDGLHAQQAGYLRLKASGIVRQAVGL